MTAQPIPATERDYQRTILEAARLFGWKVAHFRPARTSHGWRTAVEGDGAGFPDLVMVHPAGLVWFIELKRDDNPTLRPDQVDWRDALTRAGAIWRLVRVPSELEAFLHDLTTIPITRQERSWFSDATDPAATGGTTSTATPSPGSPP